MLGTIVYCSFFYQDWETPLGMWFLPGFERVWFHYRPWCTILTLQLREWRDENLSLGTLPWWWSHPGGALIHCLSSSSILHGPSRGMMTLPACCIAPSSHSSAGTCSYTLWSLSMDMKVGPWNHKSIVHQITANFAQVWTVWPLTFDLKNTPKPVWGCPRRPNGRPCMISTSKWKKEESLKNQFIKKST